MTLEQACQDQVAVAAKSLGVRYRRVWLQPGWWRHDSGRLLGFDFQGRPGILAWDNQGCWFRAFRGAAPVWITSDSCHLIHETGYLFYPASPDRPVRAETLIVQALKNHQMDLAQLGLGAVLGAASLVTGPLALLWFWEHGASPAVIAAAALSLAAAFFCRYCTGILAQRIAAGMVSHLQAILWDRMLRLPVGFWRNHFANDMAARVSGLGQNRVAELFSGLAAGPAMLGMAGVLWGGGSAFAGAVMVVYLVAAAVLLLAVHLPAARADAANLGLEHENARDAETMVRGMNHLATVGRSQGLKQRWQARQLQGMALKRSRNRADMADLLARRIFPVVGLAALGWAEPGLSANEAGCGLFLILLMTVFGRAFFRGIAGLAELVGWGWQAGPVLAAPITRGGTEGQASSAPADSSPGQIVFRKVSFRYPEAVSNACANLCLTIEKGSYIGIVGASGSGKSTLIRLLLGFDMPDQGEILYNGHPLTRDTALGARAGLVLQNDRLLPGTVLNTIISSAPGAGMAEAWAAAKKAAVDQDIADMAMGMGTIVDEHKLTGSQRQRLLLARVLVREPSIIVLDEALGLVDMELSGQIRATLNQVCATRILVSQQLDAVRDCDFVVVMKEGQIVQQGAFDRLVQESGELARLAGHRAVTGPDPGEIP